MAELKVSMPKSMFYLAVGKGALVTILGAAIGYNLALKAAADVKRGQELTLAAYTADFAKYQASLTSKHTSMAISVFVCIFILVMVFALYEVLGYAIGRLIQSMDRFSGWEEDVAGTPPAG